MYSIFSSHSTLWRCPMKQDQNLLIDPMATMSGFNYNFCKALYKSVATLNLTGELYTRNEQDRTTLSGMGAACINHLQNQLFTENEGYSTNAHIAEEDLAKLLLTAKAFLAIFEKKGD